LDAAEPIQEAALADAAIAFVSPEYVYLLRIAVLPEAHPNANIPTQALPEADPKPDATEAAVPAETTHPEYVYLFLVET
jgi:hypothetical protein